jgi:hypothetical protein
MTMASVLGQSLALRRRDAFLVHEGDQQGEGTVVGNHRVCSVSPPNEVQSEIEIRLIGEFNSRRSKARSNAPRRDEENSMPAKIRQHH